MRNTETSGLNLFDAADYIENRETSLAVAALLAGLDLDDFDSITIDDLIFGIRDIFLMDSSPPTSHAYGERGIADRHLNPAHLFNRKRQWIITHKIRTDWRDLHMAKWVRDNG